MDVETTLEYKKLALQRALEDYELAKKDQQSVLEKLERVFDGSSTKSESLPPSVRASVDALSEAGSGKGEKGTYVSTLHVSTGGADEHTDDLAKQNEALRSKLEEEHGSYKRKLQAYQDSQQRQATLVQKLQDKVLQYKRKCNELEQVVSDKSADEMKSAAQKLTSALDERDLDLESAIIHLEEERHRNASLIHVNAMLREQLDQATAANQALTADIAKLTADWQQTREELEAKEAEWQKEEESFNNFFSQEHSRLLSLWREVVSFRRQFGDMKAANETDLGKVRAEVTKASRTMHSAMQALSSTLRMSDMEKSVALQKSEEARAELEAALAAKTAELAAAAAGAEELKETLHEKITQLNVLMERQREDLKDRDSALGDAKKALAALDGEKGDVVVALDNKTEQCGVVVSQEALLQEALRGIAETLMSDAEILPDEAVPVQTGLEREPSPLRSVSPSRSPNRAERAPAFAETAVAAVQAALTKRQLQLQDTRAKLLAEKDRTAHLSKNLGDSTGTVKQLEDQVLALKEQLGNTGRAKDDAGHDKNRVTNALGVSESNKKYLEQTKASLIETINNLEKEIEKLRLANVALQRQRDNLEDDKDDIIKDNERHLKELDRAGQTIEEMTAKNSALKEELVATKETLNQTSLDREVIDTERIEVADSLQKAEIKLSEFELEISRLKTEEAGLRDALLKMQALNEGLGQDKIELNKLVAALEAEKDELLNKGSDDTDLMESQKETIAKLEGEISDLLAEKNGLEQQLRLSEAQLEAREEEIRILNREKGEVQEQLSTATRQKNALADELLAARQEVEVKTAAAAKLTNEKENLMKEKGNLIVQLTAAERDNRQQAELIAGLKGDKENLETALYETQQLAAQLESRKEQLEGENQELLLRKEQLGVDVARVRKEMEVEVEKLERAKDALNAKILDNERQFEVKLKANNENHNEDMERAAMEKEGQRLQLEEAKAAAISDLTIAGEEAAAAAAKEREDLLADIDNLQKDRDESLIVAENEKQQQLSSAQTEKNALADKIGSVEADLLASVAEGEKLNRESLAQKESDRNLINDLTNDLKNSETALEAAKLEHAKEAGKLNDKIHELERAKAAGEHEIAELKTQMKLVEEVRDNVRRDLIEANRKIREHEESVDKLKKEVAELKRGLNDEVLEKEAVQKTNDDLRNKVRRTEADKNELARHLSEARQKIAVLEECKNNVEKENADLRASLREIEKSRLDARRELQELRRQLKLLEGDNKKKEKELAELLERIQKDENKDDETRKIMAGLKQRIVETEGAREALRKELANLQRKFAEFEDDARLKERDYQLALEDSRTNEQKLLNDKRNLEIVLDGANNDLHDLRQKLSSAEGRVAALEQALARCDGAKNDAEAKLLAIHSHLRKQLGFDKAAVIRGRSRSPTRGRPSAPAKGFDNVYATTVADPTLMVGQKKEVSLPETAVESIVGSVNVSDIDPDEVHIVLKDFVTELAEATKGKDEANAHATLMANHLKDTKDENARLNDVLNKVKKNLGDTEEDKRDVDGRLTSAGTTIMLQEEQIRRNERDIKVKADKIDTLERGLKESDDSNKIANDKLSKMKSNQNILESDRKKLKVALDSSESGKTQLELGKRTLEGDIARMNLVLTDKETEKEVLKNRVESLLKQGKSSEEKAQSLALNLDRLNLALNKENASGTEMNEKIQALNVSLTESGNTTTSLQDKMSELQKALTASENDRRVLQEKLEATRKSEQEAKNAQYDLEQGKKDLTQDLLDRDTRIMELEAQVRSLDTLLVQRQEAEQDAYQQIKALQAERADLQDCIATLQRKVANTETELSEVSKTSVALEKERRDLAKNFDKIMREKMNQEMAHNKTLTEREALELAFRKLEEENAELNKQLEALQASLAEAEQTHAQRLIDLTTRHRQETEMETERFRTAQLEGERRMEARERSHRQRIKGLEETIATLKDQLAQEIAKRQYYITRFPIAPLPLHPADTAIGLRSVAVAEAEAAAAAVAAASAASVAADCQKQESVAAEPTPAEALAAEPSRARRLSPTRAAALRNLSPLGLRSLGAKAAVSPSPSRANVTLKRYKK